MTSKTDALIELLFDNNASITERDEAATFLSEFASIQTVNALLLKSKDLSENGLVLNSCGESLGIIWTQQNSFDEQSYRDLSSTARYGVYIVVKSRKPEWIKEYQMEQDNF